MDLEREQQQVKQTTITPTLEDQRHVLNMQKIPLGVQSQHQVDVISSARGQDIPTVFSHHSFNQFKHLTEENRIICPIRLEVNVRFNPKTITSSNEKKEEPKK